MQSIMSYSNCSYIFIFTVTMEIFLHAPKILIYGLSSIKAIHSHVHWIVT